jgi:hypothetical protein
MADALLALIGIGLAAPGVIDVFLRAGKYVHGRLDESKKAKELATNLRTFYVDDEVDLLRLYMKSAHVIVTDARTDAIEKARLESQFQEIKTLLKSIDDFTSVILSNEWDPLRSKRRSALSELRTKTTRCKECIENLRNRVQALKDISYAGSDLLLRPGDFAWLESEDPPFALTPTAHIRQGRTSHEIRGVQPGARRLLYETIAITDYTKADIQQNLEVVVQKLAVGGSGILPLLGFREELTNHQFEIIFVLPQNDTDPIPLSNFIGDSAEAPSLNLRVALCVQLAEAVLFLHSVKLVHKSIRLDNIAVLLDENAQGVGSQSKVTIFLFGLNVARPMDQYNTTHAGELLWQRRLYQHPQRQKRVADNDYNMGHDIYSLGACALEILRWGTFVRKQVNKYGEEGYGLSLEYLKAHRFLLERDGENDDQDAATMDIVMSEPRRVQQVLTLFCENDLPRQAGNKLAGVVSDCLEMVDTEEQLGHDNLFEANDRTKIGTQFVDRILSQLREVLNAI